MSIESRVEKLEERYNMKPCCNLIIVLYDGMERPTEEQKDQYRKAQKESGRCQDCSGTCVLDWMAEASGGKSQ